MLHTYPSGSHFADLFVSTIPSPVLAGSGQSKTNVDLRSVEIPRLKSI